MSQLYKPFKCKNENHPAGIARDCFNRGGKPCDFKGENVTNCPRYNYMTAADRKAAHAQLAQREGTR